MHVLEPEDIEYISTDWSEIDQYVVNIMYEGLGEDKPQYEEVYDYDWFYFSESQTLKYPLIWRIDSWYSLGVYFNGVELSEFIPKRKQGCR